MPTLVYDGSTYELKPGETVLDTLLHAGVNVAYSCRTGACQSCLLRASEGTVPVSAQLGLKPALREQGYFLSCQLRPEHDLVLQSASGLETAATLHTLELLSPTVLRVLLCPAKPFDYRAGQYLTLLRSDGLARSYSLASLPSSDLLELHVRRVPRGRMSNWLFDEARPNDAVTIRDLQVIASTLLDSLINHCCLQEQEQGWHHFLGICQDAIRQGHRGPIYLYHGALNASGLYGGAVLSAIQQSSSTFTYHAVVLNGEPTNQIHIGPLDKIILSAHPKLTGWRGFICGDPAIVQLLKKKFFLAGMASRDISADAFVESPVVQQSSCN